MNNGKHNNRRGSVTTSRTRRRRKNDRRFLLRQADKAAAAMQRTLQDMRGSVRKAIDVPAWARDHPWAVVGTAAFMGLATGVAISAAERREASAERLGIIGTVPYAGRPSRRGSLGSVFGFVTGMLGSVLRTVVQSSVTAVAAAAVARDATPQPCETAAKPPDAPAAAA